VTDNLFDRLAELLRSAGPVNWRLAREIAESTAGPAEPVDPWLAEEYEELSHTAALMIGGASELDPAAIQEPLRAVDRRTWAGSVVEGYGYLAEPLAEGLSPTGGPFEAMLQPLGPALVGMQVGTMVGGSARQVMGNFDTGLPPAAAVGSFLVMVNVERSADDAGLDARQARLWAVLKETVYQSQAAIPWVEAHRAALVREYLDGLEFRPEQMQERLEALQDPEELDRLIQEPGGLTGLTAGPGQQEVLDRLDAFSATLAGYADHLIVRTADDLLPDLERIREAADRASIEGPTMGQALGLEIDRALHRAAATFCDEVARRWGDEALERLWEGPDSVPLPGELTDPLGWAARVLLGSSGKGVG
jgi:putative hydrolase